MLVTYSRNASLKEAFVKIFDGQHPCALCLVIQHGRAEEKKQEQQQSKSGSKLDLGLVWQPARFTFDPRGHDRIAAFESSALARADAPPTPPPRGVLDNHARA